MARMFLCPCMGCRLDEVGETWRTWVPDEVCCTSQVVSGRKSDGSLIHAFRASRRQPVARPPSDTCGGPAVPGCFARICGPLGRPGRYHLCCPSQHLRRSLMHFATARPLRPRPGLGTLLARLRKKAIAKYASQLRTSLLHEQATSARARKSLRNVLMID